MTICCTLLSIHKEFELFCQDSLLCCSNYASQPGLSPLVQKKMLALPPFSRRLSANSSIHSWRSRSRPSESRLLSLFILLFLSCWWIAPVSWCWIVTSLCRWTWRCTWRVLRWRCRGWTRTRIGRQQELRNSFKQDPCVFPKEKVTVKKVEGPNKWNFLVRTGPRGSYLGGTPCRDNKRYDILCSTWNVLPLVGSTVVFDCWPTRGNIRVLRRVFQVIELQACHRVFAPSRCDQDRERILVLLHLFAILHWPSPPLWCSWISAESPFRLSSKPCCSRCALILMLLNRPRILVPLEFFWSERWHCPGSNKKVKRSFIRIFWTLQTHVCQIPCYSAGASFLVPGFVLCPVIESGSARITLMNFTHLNDFSRWTLSVPNFYLVPRDFIPVFLLFSE